MNQQVVLKPAVGRQRPHTCRVILGGCEFELDLEVVANRQLAVELGYLFPAEPSQWATTAD